MNNFAALVCACITALAAPFVSAQDARPAQKAELIVQNAWVRWVPGASVASVYFALRNGGTRKLAVTAVESTAAQHAMLHESTVENGQARMRPRERVDVAPGQTVRFEPGGLHVMLHGLQSGIAVGQSVPLTLILSTGEKLRIAAEVRPLGAQ